ncbi:CDP-alcohol phosphatidyltransferase family protein [Polyangium aurulentum]|uniref:CDP-alcohol phosphatidyltransferase family protein n=1 Tax=Polyangium aurulentum TaxID=2567896 RepID=UPI00146DB961|nr:CDP-alcohol phosphatidyltransferase family protein [Polyangium aurulentum]UQA62917.1 CDP-alcohol phosphatidyltransferase family protein [Polyangium aurulentum]
MPPLRYFVPNGFTALSLLLGLGSVVKSAEGDFRIAAWMILWGVLLDKLDGSAARLLNATSKFGVEFDSFADFVVFGIAPAALLYFRLLATGDYVGWERTAIMIVSGVYALCLAIRLARFNVMTEGGESVFFGLPGTLLGATIGSGYLTWDKYHLDAGLLHYAPGVLITGALLMISTVRLPKLKLRKNKAMNALTIVNVGAVYVFGPLMLFPEYLFGCALLYAVGGVLYCLIRPEAPSQPEQQPASSPSPAGEAAPEQERLVA